MSLRFGSLVTVAFPFTDLSAVKRRPALVLLVHGQDVILCGVTSQLSGRRDAVRLDPEGLAVGRLPKPSEIRPFKLFTIHRSLIHSVVGHVSQRVMGEVVNRLAGALKAGSMSGRRRGRSA